MSAAAPAVEPRARQAGAAGARLQALAAPLFRSRSSDRVSPAALAWGALALILGTAIELARQGGAGALNTVYAEDGRVFLAAAISGSPAAAFGQPYMGYVHTVPRLIAEAVALLPLSWAAAALALAAAVVNAAVGVVVYAASSAHIRSRTVRVMLASSIVLASFASAEVLNNIANLHWSLIFGSFWVLLWNTRSRAATIAGCAVLLGAALSDPLTVLLAPVALLRVVALPSRRDHVFTITWAVSLLAQGAAIVISHAHRSLPLARSPLRLAEWYAYDAVGRTVFGSRWLPDAHSRTAVALAGAAAGLFVLLAVVAFRRMSRRRIALAGLAVAVSCLLFAVPVALTGVSAPRYAFAPGLLLLSAAAVILDAALLGAAWNTLRAALIALLVVVTVANFGLDNQRAFSVNWTAALASARAECARSSPAAVVAIPIAPSGWEMDVRCGDLSPRG